MNILLDEAKEKLKSIAVGATTTHGTSAIRLISGHFNDVVLNIELVPEDSDIDDNLKYRIVYTVVDIPDRFVNKTISADEIAQLEQTVAEIVELSLFITTEMRANVIHESRQRS